MFDEFFQNSSQKIDEKLPKTAFFWSRVSNGFNLAGNGNLTWCKYERGPKHQQVPFFAIVKWSFVPSLGLKEPEISRRKLFSQSRAKNIGKIAQGKKKLKSQVKH